MSNNARKAPGPIKHAPERLPIPPDAAIETLFGRFLVTKQISYVEAAIALGVTRSYSSMLAAGRATPGLKLAIKIEDWTDGSVPARSWLITE